jgi:hypothetical protein
MKKYIRIIIFDGFYLSITFYILAMLLEWLKPGIVSNYLNLNQILLIPIFLAIICILFENINNS